MRLTGSKLLLLIAAAGLLLRLSMIDYSLPNAERIALHFSNRPLASEKPENLNVFRVLNSFFSDEADIIGAISNMKPKNFDFNPKEHYWGHTQFYAITAAYGTAYLLHYIPLKPGKFFYFEHPEEMAKLYRIGRLLTMLMATASIVMMFFLVRRLWGEGAAVLAAFLLTIMPLHVLLSNIMAFDVAMNFWAVVSVYFLVRYMQKGEKRILWATGIAFGLTMGSKYHGLFVGLPILYVMWLRDKRLLSTNCLKCLSIAAFTFILTNPYLFLDWRTVYEQGFHKSIIAKQVEHVPVSLIIGHFLHSVLFRSPLKMISSWGLFATPILIAFALYGFLQDKKNGFIFLLLVLPVFILDGLFQASVLRYFLLTNIFLIPLAAFGFTQVSKRYVWSLGFFVIVALHCLWLDIQMVAMSKDPYAEHVAGKWIVENIPKGASIGVFHRMYFSPPIDWENYQVIGFMQNRSDKIAPDYFVLPDFAEHAWIRKELGASYHEIAHVGRYPDWSKAPGWRRPNLNEMGEFQAFQTPYVILARD